MLRYLIIKIFCYLLSSTFAATSFSTLQSSIFFLFFFNCLELQLVLVDTTLVLLSYTTMHLCTWRSHNIQLDANLGIANMMSKDQWWLTQKKFQGMVWKIKREFFEKIFWDRYGDGRPYNNVPMSALAQDWRRWGRETGTRDGFWKLEFWTRAEEEKG